MLGRRLCVLSLGLCAAVAVNCTGGGNPATMDLGSREPLDGGEVVDSEDATSDGTFDVKGPACGDGFCQLEESDGTCPQDCDGPGRCGDAVCQPTEDITSCAEDCDTEACGDGACQAVENCTICPEDCGGCAAVCGDGVCNGDEGEDCGNCEADCGDCMPGCGDGICGDGEDCQVCPADCGNCPPLCGDGACSGEENCQTCSLDCGDCPAYCGDGICDESETHEACPQDCEEPGPHCGDGVCDEGEDPAVCPEDCEETTEPIEGTFYDEETGLLWENPGSSSKLTFEDALERCADLELGGLDDWRLPTISELRSLIAGCPSTVTGGSCKVTDNCVEASCAPLGCTDCQQDAGPEDGCYWLPGLVGECTWTWSQSTASGMAGEFSWSVVFFDGAIRQALLLMGLAENYVRCVR